MLEMTTKEKVTKEKIISEVGICNICINRNTSQDKVPCNICWDTYPHPKWELDKKKIPFLKSMIEIYDTP